MYFSVSLSLSLVFALITYFIRIYSWLNLYKNYRHLQPKIKNKKNLLGGGLGIVLFKK